ncbi:MAG TPA: hypothetical protein VLM89_17115, partial [Phycisphaerae bacterium]|nr:hypothetical protein [Phycisphaerae bacterium]
MLRRAYRTDVSLVSGGKAACAVVYPSESSDWRGLAEQVAGAIKALGADEVVMVSDTEAVPKRLGPLREDLEKKSLILLGDLNTNRALFAFYASYYTCCDGRYPGGAGYELRTVVRPFGRDANCLIIGGSSKEGCAAGVARFVERLKSLRRGRTVYLPYLLEVRLGDELRELLAPAI